MYGRFSTNINTMYRYDDAVRKEAEIVPVRGDAAGTKPLAERRKKFLNIRKGKNDEIIVRLYNTDVVTYCKNGDIVLQTGRWQTATTHEVMALVTGSSVFSHDSGSWVACEWDRNGERVHGYLPFGGEHTPEVFSRSESGRLYTAAPTFPVIRVKDRAASKRVQEGFKGFITYMVAMTKLRVGNNMTMQEYGDVFGWDESATNWHKQPTCIRPHLEPDQMLELAKSKDLDDQYKLLLCLAWDDAVIWTDQPHPSVSVMKARFDKVLLTTHYDHILVSKQVTTGRVVKDLYKRYPKSKTPAAGTP